MIKVNLSTAIAGITLRNPVLVASGTFGYGDEAADLVPLKELGGIVTKTVTLRPRPGNPPPRLAEVTSGILNTIGLQNVGLDGFLSEKLPGLTKLDVPVVVSIAGETADEYLEIAKVLEGVSGIAGIELNLSCPNLQKKIICLDASLVETIVRGVRQVTSLPVIAKLSPMVPDIGALAMLAEVSGAAAISVVNTFPGMAIDLNSWKPKLSTVTGGMSGPAIKPLAVRCVWETARRVKVPVIGGGGIMTGEDAVEFLLAGASAVSVGTANFVDPQAPVKIKDGIEKYLKDRKMRSLSEIIGQVKVDKP